MSKHTIRFEIDGMTCAGCAGRAERALAGVAGVETARVNLANESAQVTGAAGLPALRGALRDAGYPAREERVVLTISGMHCASCVAKIEDALGALPGVVSAQVNLATERADIRILKGAADVAALIQSIRDVGYDAAPLEGQKTDDRAAREQDALWRDTLMAGALTLPVFLTVMGAHLIPALHDALMATLGHAGWWGAQFVLTTLVLVGPGRRFFRTGLPLLFKGSPDMNSLVALGTAAAWGYSSVALFLPGLLPEGTREVYFEAAGVIVTLILLGRWLEARAKGQTGAAIRKLLALRPDTARVERDGTVTEIAIDAVQVGDIVHLRPGERVAVDGEIVSGHSYLDEAMMTGEPVPVEKGPGDPLTGGTVNTGSALTYRATAVGGDTVLARIVAMVEEAQGAKLPIQALADRVVRIFVPVVLVIAALTVAVWLIFGPDPALSLALVAGVSVLIISCPCAMGLATPTSIMVGTGRAAELGVLFRKGDALQALDGVRVVAFDKTGTLTEGAPSLVAREGLNGWDADEVLRLVAGAEAGSEHPIARALEQAAAGPLPEADSTESVAGHGLIADIAGKRLLIGTRRLMDREHIATDAFEAPLAAFAEAGHTPVLVAIDGAPAAAFAVADPVKPEARAAIAALHAAGVQVAMITGDTKATGQAIGRALGIDRIAAEVLPDGKVDAVRDLRRAFGAVAFVGDGINDAPALAEADVGIAIGTGTDIAVEAGDVVLASGSVSGVAVARQVSAAVMRNIRQNLVWAFGYNVALIPVAAGVLYPLTGHLLSPMLAAGAMAASSVFVVTNALRLRRITAEEAQG